MHLLLLLNAVLFMTTLAHTNAETQPAEGPPIVRIIILPTLRACSTWRNASLVRDIMVLQWPGKGVIY